MVALNPGALEADRSDPLRFPALNTWLFALVFLTSSFDVFLNFKVMGFSLRACYCLILLLLLLNAPRLHLYLLSRPGILGGGPLLIWTCFLLLFIANTQYLPRNIGYMGWHLCDLGFIVLLVRSVNREETFLWLYRAYLASFVAVAVFGLIQFLSGLFGVGLLTTQWYFPRLARINGFSYEPSYFGSYLIIGWIQVFMWSLRPQGIFGPGTTKAMLAIMTVCLVLSTSRMSILVALLFILANAANQVLKLLVGFRIRPAWIAIILATSGAVGTFLFIVVTNWDAVKFLFAGLGIAGGSTHSSGARIDLLKDTFGVFLRNPLIGVSLGGIAPSIAEAKGFLVASNEAAKVHEGANIFAEVLAASGIAGFPFFLAYLWQVFGRPLRLMADIRSRDPVFAYLLASMLLALFFELLILSMNQNILRPYLWIHIGMVSLAYKLGRMAQPAAAGTGPAPEGESV